MFQAMIVSKHDVSQFSRGCANIMKEKANEPKSEGSLNASSTNQNNFSEIRMCAICYSFLSSIKTAKLKLKGPLQSNL
jgi:hypothetical protein